MTVHICMEFVSETLSNRWINTMEERIDIRSDYDGLGLSILVTRPKTDPVAVLQVVHGMKGHKERFLSFMTFMSEHGVLCVAGDLRGHGASVRKEEDRGYMYDGGYIALVEDLKQVTDWIHQTYPSLPVFLLGHSMGSLAVRTYMKSHDDAVSGIFLCGSPSNTHMSFAGLYLARFLCLFRNGRLKTGMIQRLTSMVYNRRFFREGPEAWTCSDADARRRYASDPLCSFDFTANAMKALLSMMRETYSLDGWSVDNPDVPIYFISGGDDPCMRGESSLHASAQHLADLGYHNVTSAIYSGMRHEVLNEVGKETVWDDILTHILDAR